MNFGRVNIGAIAGFVSGAASGPIYGLTVLAASGGEVLGADVDLDAGLILGLPWAILFGCVLAGLPGILFGMAMGASIGDKPMVAPIIVGVAAVGAVAGVSLLQSVNDGGLTVAVVIRGAVVGSITAYLWTNIFNTLRARTAGPGSQANERLDS